MAPSRCSPTGELLERYRKNGGKGRAIAALKVCWNEDEQVARKLAHEMWPTEGVEGQLAQELALPSHFEAAAANVTGRWWREEIACGPDPEVHVGGRQQSTSRRDSTRSTSTRSGPTRRAASASTKADFDHGWEPEKRGTPGIHRQRIQNPPPQLFHFAPKRDDA